jgi:hypothetical protein
VTLAIWQSENIAFFNVGVDFSKQFISLQSIKKFGLGSEFVSVLVSWLFLDLFALKVQVGELVQVLKMFIDTQNLKFFVAGFNLSFYNKYFCCCEISWRNLI